MFRAASPVAALDAWLHSQDRHNTDNTIIASGEDPSQFFLDFSNSMNYQGKWSGEGYKTFTKSSYNNDLPELYTCNMSSEIVRQTTARIAAIADDVVADIIQRVPSDFLSHVKAQELAKCLIWRKNLLSENFEKWYPGKAAI